MSDFATPRQNMVDGQIRPSSVTDWRIIDAMRSVPREAFVPASQRALAYLDLDLDVSGTGAVKQYLLKPVVTARILQAVDLIATDNVLVVGCASGYAAALAASLAGRVTATVGEESMAAQAREILGGLGFSKVTVRTAKAAEGYAADSPYDAIILNGATEVVPAELYEQLRIGGRLVGVFATEQPQRAILVTRSSCDFGSRVLFDATAPVLPGLERAAAFVF
jgi:protein-L-isoaspartate(D-aspartate) O-methyltransferase